jgi:hypothetical protein
MFVVDLRVVLFVHAPFAYKPPKNVGTIPYPHFKDARIFLVSFNFPAARLWFSNMSCAKKMKLAQKSSNLDPKASFAIPSIV